MHIKIEILSIFLKFIPERNFFSRIMDLQAFVYENNIFYSDGPDGNYTHQITIDSDALVLNGITDWIYNEEIFNSIVVSE